MKSLFQVWVLSVAVLFVSPAYAFGYTIDDAIKAYEEKDYKNAYTFFSNLAEDNNLTAQVYLGFMYGKGHGVKKDYEQSILWYEKAAKQGDPAAQRNLGYMYQQGLGVDKNDTQAAYWYRKAAIQGDAGAQNNLGSMYENGHGVEQSDLQAVNWYRDAANKGNSIAQRNLARMYEQGKGVSQDYSQALNRYRKAAESGDTTAQANIGLMYQKGLGVDQDDNQAVAWYQKAAAQGDALAQVFLSKMYLVGRGVEQNFDEALKLITQAAAKNEDSEIQSILKIVAQRGVLESPLTLRTAGKNRILDRGTYVIALLDEKRMLHPYEGTFSTEINLREGDTIKVQTQHDENNVTSEIDEDLPLNLELTTDFLIKELRLDGALIPLSEVKPNDDPQLIQTTASVLVSPSHLTNGAILSVISRAGRESRLNLTLRDGQFTVATPADMGL